MRLLSLGLLVPLLAAQTQEPPLFQSELIFPLEAWHNHASSLVELPGGDLLACWYHGSGEREADDVKIEAARLPAGGGTWSQRFTLADTPGFPDCNPVLFLDSRRRLWLLWPVILANQWHTALLKYRISTSYLDPEAPPQWEFADNLLVRPRRFLEKVREVYEPRLRAPGGLAAYFRTILDRAADKHFSRLGWMTRAHPLELPGGRILVPLYSDGFDFSLIAITDDGGASWQTSDPLVSHGGIQPALVRRKDGTLVAWMRDNGPPPKRVHTSTSTDSGLTWTPVVDTELPNPGSALDAIALNDGAWVMVYNDTEQGRWSLAVALSGDEGRTWKWRRHLERDTRESGRGSFHYPSIIQAADGSLHVTYSYFLNHLPEGAPRKAIKHARFNLAWIRQGD